MRPPLAARRELPRSAETLWKTLRLSIGVGKFDVERGLEPEHQVDARMRRHARLEEVRVVVERRDVDRQMAVLADDLPDPFLRT